MAYDIPGLITQIKRFEPKAIARMSEDFSSLHQDHREKIRKSIADTLKTGSSIMDLGELPKLKDWSVSISHCHGLGGWVAVPRPLKVGFDLEVKSRINPKLIKRIAQEGELDGIPDPAFLWCAKESYFKALGDQQPTAVTQIRVDKWSKNPDGDWRFSSSNLRGSMFFAVDLLVSVALV
jgi:hypothetical protein